MTIAFFCLMIAIFSAIFIMFNKILGTFYHNSYYYNNITINLERSPKTFYEHIKYIDKRIQDIECSDFTMIDIGSFRCMYPSNDFVIDNTQVTLHKNFNNQLVEIKLKCFYKNELFEHCSVTKRLN